MRRAWLLAALLALPAVGWAQAVPTPTAGTITFPTELNTAVDKYINEAECLDGTITLMWAPVYVTTPTVKSATDLVGGSYQLYASDHASESAVTSGDCATPENTKGVTGLNAGDVGGGQITGANVTDPSPQLEFETDLIASVAGLGACNVSDTNIMLCVQARDSGGNLIGTARTTLIVSTKAPNAPASASATPGEEALNVSWAASTDTPVAEYYIAEVRTGPAIDPTVSTSVSKSSGPVAGGVTTGTIDTRIEGLTNGVVYEVFVTAYSTADNASDPVFAGTASPAPVNDFWETYRAAGGREQGGCAPGAAGPLALLAAVSLLALLRRRK